MYPSSTGATPVRPPLIFSHVLEHRRPACFAVMQSSATTIPNFTCLPPAPVDQPKPRHVSRSAALSVPHVAAGWPFPRRASFPNRFIETLHRAGRIHLVTLPLAIHLLPPVEVRTEAAARALPLMPYTAAEVPMSGLPGRVTHYAWAQHSSSRSGPHPSWWPVDFGPSSRATGEFDLVARWSFNPFPFSVISLNDARNSSKLPKFIEISRNLRKYKPISGGILVKHYT
jgi:hypothetical protein